MASISEPRHSLTRAWSVRCFAVTTLGALAIVAAAPDDATAHDAFPVSTSIFVPTSSPGRTVLGTTFGLVASSDGGRRWHLSCEEAISSFVSHYRIGPPPASHWYALSVDGLKISRNSGCAWQVLAGNAQGILAVDFSLDPTDDGRVLVAARTATVSAPYGLFELDTDAEEAVVAQRYATTAGERLESVEIAPSEPRTIYATMTQTGTTSRTFLLRSHDGGETFERFELSDLFERRAPRLLGVDPRQALNLYLRIIGTERDLGDQLAISRDGGETWSLPLTAEGAISGLLPRDDGTLLVIAASTTYVSTDGGFTFAPWLVGPTVRALAERDGQLFVAADNFVDGFAVGITRDDGATWEPLFGYDDIVGPVECEPTGGLCQQSWTTLADLLQRRMPPGSAPPQVPRTMSGCTCTVVRPSESGLAQVLVLFVWLTRRVRRGG